MASSMSVPLLGRLALGCRWLQRASSSTPNPGSGLYSPRSVRVGSRILPFAVQRLGALLLKAVGDGIPKDQAKHHRLVPRHVHDVAQLVGREPELGHNNPGWRCCCQPRFPCGFLWSFGSLRVAPEDRAPTGFAPTIATESLQPRPRTTIPPPPVPAAGLLKASPLTPCSAQSGVLGGVPGGFQGFKNHVQALLIGH
jgi:hypothetical protein